MDKRSNLTVTAMEGGGFYNRHSELQAAGIARVLPMWDKIARSVRVGDETIVIADYGSSQGRNSMAPMRVAIAALKAASDSGRAAQVIHTDLPANDFGSLFQSLIDEPDSYLKGANNIFPSAVGRSYFEPIIAPGTVHLGWNSWTLQWLSSNPIEVADHIIAGYSADETARTAVFRQAAQDWHDFIAARSSELRPGGKLLSLFAASQEDRLTWRWLFEELWGAAADLGASGLLSERELMRMTLPLAGRTLGEIKAPFADHGTCCEMAIEFADVIATPDPFWTEFEQTGDAAHLGRSWANIWRAVTGPALASALDPGRKPGAVLDQLFSRFAARVAASPREQKNSIALVILRKNEPAEASPRSP